MPSVVLGGVWGQPPPLDLEAEADLHTLLSVLADRQLHPLRARHLRRRHRRCPGAGSIPERHRRNGRAGPVADGAPALRPLCRAGLTVLVTARSQASSTRLKTLPTEYGYFAARIGTTGGDRLEINVVPPTHHLRLACDHCAAMVLSSGSHISTARSRHDAACSSRGSKASSTNSIDFARLASLRP